MSKGIISAGVSVKVGRARQLGERSAARHADVEYLGPGNDWGDLGVADQCVLIYKQDTHLLDAVSRFIGTGLAAGEAAIVIATPLHRDRIEAQLRAHGVDLAAAHAQGQYVPVDAAETLAQCMSGGWPDEDRFSDVVGSLITSAASRYPHVRIFGEMVTFLWSEEHADAALRLETLWHDLLKTCAFPLLCAYPRRDVASAGHGQRCLTICTAQSHVVPAESSGTLPSADERQRAVVQLQQKSQALAAEIAERQRLDQALRRSEQELADFFDHAPMGLHWVGPDGIILRANEAELRLLGYSREDYLGHHIAEFHADPHVIADILRRLQAGEELHDYRARMVCQDGTIKHVLIDSNVLWEEGQFIHTRCFTRDITMHAQATEIRERLAALVDSSDDAIIGQTLDGIITSWNRGAERLYGYSAAEVVGKPLSLLIPPDLPDDLPQLLGRLQQGEGIDHYETQRLHKDGTRHDVSLTISPIRDGTGRLIGASKIARDITERKRAEQALQQAYADLERRVEERTAALHEEIAAREHAQAALMHREKLAAMGSLLASVAHELNNPLSVVVMQADILGERAGTGPLASHIAELTDAAGRCAEIVHHFLALARQQPPSRTRVELNAIIAAAMKLLAYPLRVDTIHVEYNLAEELPALWADAHQLQQVVLNLVTNAHQALRETGGPRQLTLTTRAESARQRVILEVADTGPGIPPAVRERIFEPFFTTKPLGVGTGLGLPLCLGIVEGHGGTLSVESPPQGGTVFRVELPLQPVPADGPVPAAAPPSAPHGETILIIDDEPGIARALTSLLRRDGYAVETAANGRLALEKCQSRDYTLILCDLRMPEMDGPGFYQALQHRHPALCQRVLFLTGDALDPEVQTFLDHSARPRLSKPFTAAMVRQAILTCQQRRAGQ